MNLTTEQTLAVVEAKAGKNILLNSCAGSGKTSTLRAIAKELKHNCLYLAFNTAIAKEAKSDFPFNTTAKTIHSLAFHWAFNVKKLNKAKNSFYFQYSDIQVDDKVPYSDIFKTQIEIIEVIKQFCYSSYGSLAEFVETLDEKPDFELIERYWKKLIAPNNSVKITPDVYLKLWQLSEPDLSEYQTILLDEAQDSNPVTLDIVLKQLAKGVQLILVGDRWQSIYSFRAAINAFEFVEDLEKMGLDNKYFCENFEFEKLFLTKSFRCPQDILNKANFLIQLVDAEYPIIEGIADNSDWAVSSDLLLSYITSYKIISSYDCFKTKAIICKSNFSVLRHFIYFAKNKIYVNCTIDFKEIFSKLYHVAALKNGETIKFPNTSLVKFKTFIQLQKAAEKDIELKTLLGLYSLVMESGGIGYVKTLKDDYLDIESSLTITTCHKAKGLEWDFVELDEDLFQIEMPDESRIDTELTTYDQALEETIEDWLQSTDRNLEVAYVAITRAKKQIVIPKTDLTLEIGLI